MAFEGSTLQYIINPFHLMTGRDRTHFCSEVTSQYGKKKRGLYSLYITLLWETENKLVFALCKETSQLPDGSDSPPAVRILCWNS